MTSNDTDRPDQTSGLRNFFDTLRRSPVTRSTEDRWAGGVCAGVADRLGVDPVLVRVLTAVLVLLGGVGAVVYGLAWLALPDRAGRIEAEQLLRGDVRPAAVLALLLVLFGGLLPNPWQWWWPGAAPVWDGNPVGALLLAAVVVAVLVWVPRRGLKSGPPPDQTGPVEAARFETAPVQTAPREAAPPIARPARRPGRRGPGALTTTVVLGLALVLAGIAAISAQRGALDMPTSVAAATAATGVVGLTLVALGIAGRRDGAVGFWGVTLMVVAIFLAVVPRTAAVDVTGGAWTPTSVHDAAGGYAVVVGDGRIDLTDLPALRSDLVVPVRLGIGQLEITVPDGVDVTVRSHTVVGSTDDATSMPPGWTSTGSHSGIGTDATLTSRGSAGGPGLVVDAKGLIGDIRLVVADR